MTRGHPEYSTGTVVTVVFLYCMSTTKIYQRTLLTATGKSRPRFRRKMRQLFNAAELHIRYTVSVGCNSLPELNRKSGNQPKPPNNGGWEQPAGQASRGHYTSTFIRAWSTKTCACANKPPRHRQTDAARTTRRKHRVLTRPRRRRQHLNRRTRALAETGSHAAVMPALPRDD